MTVHFITLFIFIYTSVYYFVLKVVLLLHVINGLLMLIYLKTFFCCTIPLVTNHKTVLHRYDIPFTCVRSVRK